MPKVSSDITGRVIDAQTKQPIPKFIVAVFSGTERVLYQLPPGYPIPPGRLVAEKIIESADGSFTLPSYPGLIYIGVSAEGHERYMSEAMEVTKPLTIALAPAPPKPPAPPREEAMLSGLICDANGAPFSSAGIVIECAGERQQVGDARQDGTFGFMVPRVVCTIEVGPRLRNDEEHYRLAATEPRVMETVDMRNGARTVELVIPTPSAAPPQSPPQSPPR